jgi:Fur family ferric uptake transcriptional regulator
METNGYLDSLRPAGSKRSSKRDLIVNVFLRQEGHLTADDLFDLIRREGTARAVRPPDESPDASPHDTTHISRATVYRTLQWMVDAGIARKVDFGEGRFRFEHSYRHPRHFHLICKSCNQSFEFLSSDIESLLEEVAAARNFTARQSVLQIHGTCEACRTGRPAVAERGVTELLFARDALRIAIATERSGLEFYSRAARITRDARGRKIFEKLADEEKDHLGTLEARYRELLQQDPQLESRPTFLFFKGAANGLFAAGAERLANGVDDRQALMIGIKCERGSHRFFKRYGEKFEDSEGKKIFLEFADEERAHLELLIREYRSLVERQSRRRAPKSSKRKTRRQAATLS